MPPFLDSIIDFIVQSDLLTILIVGLILALAAELGFQIGRRPAPERRKAFQGQSNAVQGAILGLLGLLLGFTFAMSVSRFDSRRQLVLAESNGIGTLWLRAGFLSDTGRDTLRSTVMDYIDARLEGAKFSPGSSAFQEQALRSERYQGTMWKIAISQVMVKDTPSTALFTAALNDVIDLDSKRQAAARNHVPSPVWLLVVVVSVTACGVSGYATGLGESGRHPLAMLVLPLLLTVVITIIADLDNPRHGLIKVGQQSMADLRSTLSKY